MLIQKFEANDKGRDFVVGDLHGCLRQFQTLLREIGFDPAGDRMFSVGDLIDRGPESEATLALLNEPWFYAVRGNHEEILSIVAEMPTFDNWMWWTRNGGEWARTLAPARLQELANQVRALPLAIAVGEGQERFNVIHAEFFGDDEMLDSGEYSEMKAQQLMWGRQLIDLDAETASKISRLSPTYCGHTIDKEIRRAGSQIYIDTGAFVGAGWMGREPDPDYGVTIVEPATGRAWRT